MAKAKPVTACALTALNPSVVTSAVMPHLTLTDVLRVATVNRAHHQLAVAPAVWRGRCAAAFSDADIAAAVQMLSADNKTATVAGTSDTKSAPTVTAVGGNGSAAHMDWRAVFRVLYTEGLDTRESFFGAAEREWPQVKPPPDDPPFSILKVVIAGDGGAGKSSALLYFVDGQKATGSYISTIGIDFKITRYVLPALKFPHPPNGTPRVKLQIWDTASPERFRTITRSYYRGAHALVLCVDPFDASAASALERCDYTVKEAESARTDGAAPIATVLFATKQDLDDRVATATSGNGAAAPVRHLSARTIREWCAARDVLYVETSAVTGRGIVRGYRAVIHRAVNSWLTHNSPGPAGPVTASNKPAAPTNKANWSCTVQ